MAKNIFPISNICRHFIRQNGQDTIRKMSSERDVLYESINNAGVITLNRPKALNSVDLPMVKSLFLNMKQWEKEKSLVIVKGAGGKAFCSGGDIRAVIESYAKGSHYGRDFFRNVYTLNGAISTYAIPYIFLIDGVFMGGGVGLTMHGPYRIATERTLFALPETAIGLFPDVGASYYLPRLCGKLGLYLGLLSYRLKGSDVFKAGIASYYVESKSLKELETELVQCKNKQDIDEVLKKFSVTDNKEFSLKPHLDQINRCFNATTVEDIIGNLEKDNTTWAQKTLKTLEKMCPTSLKITLKQLELGSKMTLLECMQMEYRIASNCLANKNFFEGVRAILIDKDQNPKWTPPTLAEVRDEFVESHFTKLPEDEELKHKL